MAYVKEREILCGFKGYELLPLVGFLEGLWLALTEKRWKDAQKIFERWQPKISFWANTMEKAGCLAPP